VAGARRRSSGAGTLATSTLVLDRGTSTTDEIPAGPVAGDTAGPTTGPTTGDREDVVDGRRMSPTGAQEVDADGAQTEAGSRSRGSAGLWASAIGATLALALLAASLVYALRPAVSDTDRTAAVGSARTTLESLLSYSGSAFDQHVGEVTPQLTSPFKDQFTKVAATDIKPMAVKNDATVQAKVYDAGVMDADGDGGEGTTVRVMAFVNQATTTKAQQAPAIDQNRVIATMRKVGDRWLVSELSAF
jgi:Mce-associated membrane protein